MHKFLVFLKNNIFVQNVAKNYPAVLVAVAALLVVLAILSVITHEISMVKRQAIMNLRLLKAENVRSVTLIYGYELVVMENSLAAPVIPSANILNH